VTVSQSSGFFRTELLSHTSGFTCEPSGQHAYTLILRRARTLEGVFGQFESMVISRFLGRCPKESIILGDINGSPECRRVVFAALPKEGAASTVGGKYSEAIVARVITETEVVDEVKTEKCTEDGGERRTRLYTPGTRRTKFSNIASSSS
jgi:hypothetical protein